MQKSTITLAEICKVEKGKIGIKAAVPGQYPLVTTGEERGSHNEFHFEGEAVCIPLVSATGHGHASIKRLHFQKGKFCVGSILAACIPKDYKRSSAKFLYLYLSLLKDSILVPLMQGSANVSLRLKDLEKVEVPNISLKEQLKIVDLIDRLQHQQNQLNDELSLQQSYLQQLRHSILQEAVQGKLSETGFVGLNDFSEEKKKYGKLWDAPASELLKHIKVEKEKLKKTTVQTITADEIPFDLPEGWVWCKLGEIALSSEAGKSHKCLDREIEGSEWGIIKMSAISSAKFIETKNKFYRSNIIEDKNNQIKKGDLLFTRASGSRELTGISCLVKSISLNLLLNDKTIRFRFPEYLVVNFLNLWNNTVLARAYYEKIMGSKTTTMNNITREQFNNLYIPLPPLSQQYRIVAKVEQLLQIVGQLEQQIATSQTQAQQLLQTVLNEAFGGTEKEYAVNELLTLAAEE